MEISLGEAITMTARNKPDAPSFVFADGTTGLPEGAGYLDARGYLYLSGRNKDMIVRGGENIYPIEIESVLADHPAIAQSAVVGLPDEHWSEIVRAWVTLGPGATVTAEELAAHCGQRLATYKVPAEFRFTDALPVNASGKILKRELRTRD